MNELIDFIMKLFEPHSWFDRIAIATDAVGLSLSILFFGFGFKNFVDSWFPTCILMLTVVSLTLTIVKKAYDIYQEVAKPFFKKWFKKQ